MAWCHFWLKEIIILFFGMGQYKTPLSGTGHGDDFFVSRVLPRRTLYFMESHNVAHTQLLSFTIRKKQRLKLETMFVSPSEISVFCFCLATPPLPPWYYKLRWALKVPTPVFQRGIAHEYSIRKTLLNQTCVSSLI